MSEHDRNTYQRKAMCEEKHKQVDEKFQSGNERMDCIDKELKKLNGRVLTALVFVIVTLVTILTSVIMKAF